MSSPRYRPKRRLRSEIFPLVLVLSLPLAIFLAFPGGAVGFIPSSAGKAAPTRSAFIELDAAREAKLLASARASWQSDSASRRGVRANLLNCSFSERNVRIAAGLAPEAPVRLAPFTDYEIDAVPQGVAAEGPSSLPAEQPQPSAPAFPESELLKLK